MSRWVRLLRSFARSEDGGAVVVSGGILLMIMLGVGAAMTNYAWREAQWEDLRAATRAAVSAAGPLLAGAGGAMDAAIRERVASFTMASMPGLTVAADDVVVSYDADTGTTTITVRGQYEFRDIWFNDLWTFGGGDSAVENVVKARLESERYEVAVALDISGSMKDDLAAGVTKLDGLKAAMANVVDGIENAAATTPGGMLVSIVPFASGVNVADTCNPDPDTGLCRAARSTGKERYVRMLAGVRPTMAETLADARQARASGVGGHWVDTFHQYGAGIGLGPLRRQFLPSQLLDDLDWDLRQEDVDIEVSTQIPDVGDWTVDHEDFWNGCLMARWGAYWDPTAREPGWVQDDAGNWPAAKAVPAWSPASSSLPATTPLHLSDAPPRASDPHTLFTAYSWPDARVSGDADHLLQGTMMEMLNPNGQINFFQQVVDWPTSADNDWSRAGNSGSTLCPPVPIIPLTDTLQTLRDAIAGLDTITEYRYGQQNRPMSGTYLNLGIVWGLRTLSPLWRGIWDVQDLQGEARPGVHCAPGEQTSDCETGLTKSLLIVSDGGNATGTFQKTRTFRAYSDSNPNIRYDVLCWTYDREHELYHAAAALNTPSEFNDRFRNPNVAADWVDADDRLNSVGRERFADAYLRMALDTGNATRRTELINSLASALGSNTAASPWQLFRGRDERIADAMVASDNGFDMTGRPNLIDNRCRPSSIFGPYGRIDDFVYVGDTGPDALTAPVPVANVAPFELASVPSSVVQPGSPWGGNFSELEAEIRSRLDEWFVEACRIAGERRVRINSIFIGVEAWNRHSIGVLERCVDAAGGDPVEKEVFVAPDADTLKTAFEEIFTIRRNLRFLN